LPWLRKAQSRESDAQDRQHTGGADQSALALPSCQAYHGVGAFERFADSKFKKHLVISTYLTADHHPKYPLK
jgi:hypothetical protein